MSGIYLRYTSLLQQVKISLIHYIQGAKEKSRDFYQLMQMKYSTKCNTQS